MRSLDFLQAIAGYTRNTAKSEPGISNSANRPIRLALIDPAYSPFTSPYPNGIPAARVTFEGEGTLSGKYYPVAQGFIPMASQRVFMVPIGTTYLIAGGANPQTAQGFYQGTVTGMEFGGGSYFDTVEGLQLETDAYVAGDLVVDGIGATRDILKGTDTSRVSASVVADPQLTMSFPGGTWRIDMDLVFSGSSGDIMTSWTVTGANASTNLRTCWGPSPFTIDTTTADETQGRDSVPMRTGVHLHATNVPYGTNSASSYTSAWERAVIDFPSGGTVTLAWGQETTDAANASIMRAASLMSARRIA